MNKSQKSSQKSSIRSTPIMSKKSVANSEENILGSVILKSNLQQFYANSKEKLLKLKNEINLIDAENERQKDENNELTMTYQSYLTLNQEMEIRMKGMKEIIISTLKNKTGLQSHLKDLQKEIETTNKDIDIYKIDNNYKVKIIQNDIEHTKNTKEDQVKNLQKKIENEIINSNNLLDKIKDIRAEIEKYKDLIQDFDKVDNSRNINLLKETNEMKKFLAEL
jgi:chromosome segregation ATPase